uniref:Uncharacterized protein n=1 Tax=Anguilla anguilla TaxID=7936 RepID=A0A0E9RCP5_ANGAN
MFSYSANQYTHHYVFSYSTNHIHTSIDILIVSLSHAHIKN